MNPIILEYLSLIGLSSIVSDLYDRLLGLDKSIRWLEKLARDKHLRLIYMSDFRC
jgi:hypothetical protein